MRLVAAVLALLLAACTCGCSWSRCRTPVSCPTPASVYRPGPMRVLGTPDLFPTVPTAPSACPGGRCANR